MPSTGAGERHRASRGCRVRLRTAWDVTSSRASRISTRDILAVWQPVAHDLLPGPLATCGPLEGPEYRGVSGRRAALLSQLLAVPDRPAIDWRAGSPRIGSRSSSPRLDQFSTKTALRDPVPHVPWAPLSRTSQKLLRSKHRSSTGLA